MTGPTTTIEWRGKTMTGKVPEPPDAWEIADALRTLVKVIEHVHTLAVRGGPTRVTAEWLATNVSATLYMLAGQRLVGNTHVEASLGALKIVAQSPRGAWCERFWDVTLPLPAWIELTA